MLGRTARRHSHSALPSSRGPRNGLFMPESSSCKKAEPALEKKKATFQRIVRKYRYALRERGAVVRHAKRAHMFTATQKQLRGASSRMAPQGRHAGTL